ncbi:uncharacterized protein LOC144432949 [Glandiceps talaboti]
MLRLPIIALLCLGFAATGFAYIGIEDELGDQEGDFYAMVGLGGEDGDGDEDAEHGPLAKLLMGEGSGPLSDKPLLRMMLLRKLMGGGGEGFGPLSGLQRPTGSLARAMVLFRLLGKRMGERFLAEAKARKESHRVYTFAAALGCDCAFEYLDDDNHMKGFSLDIVEAVCKHAGKHCTVMYDTGSNCYTHVHGEHSRAGDGLMNHWYDGCLTWVRSSERMHSVAFSDGYGIAKTKAHFYTKHGNPHGFDPHNIGGDDIGFLDGWLSDEHCLAYPHPESHYEGVHLDPKHTHYYKTRKELFEAVESEVLDAAFLLDLSAKEADAHGFEHLGGEGLVCGLDNGSLHVMTRKDSNVSHWFDEALHAMKESGEYYGLCAKGQHEHGHVSELHCLD